MFKDYFNAQGLLTDVLPFGQPENCSLWLVECYFLWNKLTEEQKAKYPELKELLSTEKVTSALMSLTDGKKWYALPDHTIMANEGFSRDNMIALTAFGKATNNETMSHAGVDAFNLFRYLNPQDWFFFGLCADKWWAWKAFLFANIEYSCSSTSKTGDGFLDTDAYLLSFCRLEGAKGVEHFDDLYYEVDASLSKIIPEYLEANPNEVPANMKVTDNHWKLVFAMYFKDQNNPINVLAKEIWG